MSGCDAGRKTRGATLALLVALVILVALAVLVFHLLDRPDLLFTYAVHAVAALIVLTLLSIAGFALFLHESRVAVFEGNGARVATPVVRGVIDADTPPVFDTQNTVLPNYLPIKRSFNRLGGAELSYAFWVYKQNNIATDEASTTSTVDDGLSPRDVVLLVKGDLATSSTTGLTGGAMADVVIKSPLIKFDTSTDRLTVEFNTSDPNRVHGVVEGTVAATPKAVRPTTAAFASKVSIFGLNDPKFNARWFHVAVVLKDNDPTSRIERTVQARIFVNGEPVFDKNVVGDIGGAGVTMRQNNGFLYLMPTVPFMTTKDGKAVPTTTAGAAASVDGSPTGNLLPSTGTAVGANKLNVRMADVWHFNYALEDAEVQKLHKRGVTQKTAVVPKTVSLADDKKYLMSDPNAWRRVRD